MLHLQKYIIELMDRNAIRERLANMDRLKRVIDFVVMNQTLARPRWYVRMVMPLIQKRAWSAKIYHSARMDTPPYRLFSIGKRSVIESFACINNAVGDVTIGNCTRVGIHSTVIGPVSIGSHVIIAQGVVISALNHRFGDDTKPISEQGVDTKQIVIEDDVWIGANAVILPGVRIANHSVVAAGAVVTRDVPANSIVAGVPAEVKRKI